MTIHIVDIEAVDTRYTKQWKEHLPQQLRRATNEEVNVISGGDTPQATTPGAFLNFGGTNVYKSQSNLEHYWRDVLQRTSIRRRLFSLH